MNYLALSISVSPQLGKLWRLIHCTITVILMSPDVSTGQSLQSNLWITDGPVYAIAISGNTIYIGGAFTWVGPASGVGGVSRLRIAAIDATTGQVTSWNPGSNGIIYALSLNANLGPFVYAGGDFTNIGGQNRNRIAAINTTSGLASSWNPNSSGVVYSLVADIGGIIAGGLFSTIGGASRSNLALLSPSTGIAAPLWNPGADQVVRSLAISSGTLYVGASSNSLEGKPGITLLH